MMGTVGANAGGTGGAGAAGAGGGVRPAACGLVGGGGGGAALISVWYGRLRHPGQSKFLDSFGPDTP